MTESVTLQTNVQEPPTAIRPGLGLVGVALILPLITGVLLCFVSSFPVALGISAAMVVSTAALLAIDAYRLGRVDLKGRRREGPGVLFVGVCLLWIAVFPVAFFRRSAFGSPNLGLAALFAAAFFVSVPFLAPLVIPAKLPSCTSAEVTKLLEQVIGSIPFGATVKSIDRHREVSYDRTANVRYGECVVHTETEDLPVKFVVEWQDRSKGMFQVRLFESELPSCNSREVMQLLEQVLGGTPVGETLKAIDGHREVRYDRTANVRYGECVVHTETEDFPVKFVVEWQDRDKGIFQLRIVD